jgi:hypothetical protein
MLLNAEDATLLLKAGCGPGGKQTLNGKEQTLNQLQLNFSIHSRRIRLSNIFSTDTYHDTLMYVSPSRRRKLPINRPIKCSINALAAIFGPAAIPDIFSLPSHWELVVGVMEAR